jgi:hypothetical protein
MEKQGIAGFQFGIHQFHRLQGIVHHYHIGAYLLAGKAMVYAAHLMRAPDHLQAAVFLVCFGQANHHAQQLVGKKKLVLVPVSIILVPLPGAAHTGFFLHQLGVEMAHRCRASSSCATACTIRSLRVR